MNELEQKSTKLENTGESGSESGAKVLEKWVGMTQSQCIMTTRNGSGWEITWWREIQSWAFGGRGGITVRMQQLEARRTRMSRPPYSVVRVLPIGEEIAAIQEGWRESQVSEEKGERNAQRRDEVRFCWWSTINSRRSSRRVQKLGMSGKKGQNEKAQDVFLRREGGIQWEVC